MGEADVRVAAGVVVTALREAGRSEGTIRRYQAVLDRFAAFLAGRGLRTASDQACADFIAGQTGTRLGTLREPVADRDVNAVRRPAVLMADALAGRAVVIGQPVPGLPGRDGHRPGCPERAGRVGFPAAPARAAPQDRCGAEVGPGRLPGLPRRRGTGAAGPGRPAAAAPAPAPRVRAAPVDR